MTTHGLFKGIPRDVLAYLNAQIPADPDAFYRANLPFAPLTDLPAALVDGTLTSVPLFLSEGDLVTSLSFLSGVTAAGTMANWWFALYDRAAELIAQTADQTTAAWTAHTWKTLALSAPYKVTQSGFYLAAIMANVSAGSVPSLAGGYGGKPVVTGQRNLAQSGPGSLTATAPASISSPTAQSQVPLVVAT